ncbi:sulfatase-like hydrolase/transferase [uncultured Winogradskyella sp.]|uniref:sulfatase-like hydrolase/transferase n=1 Tax=uncultured Winogradskyella sp. TaxID=395353 RepID=UPI00262EEAB9|nr:sulfatase-like hydrolase/transferase [uncultured Winogradskyella sp.]
MYILRVLIICVLITSSKSNTEATQQDVTNKTKAPNIVYILADDMGYGDLSALNSESAIQTPYMDNILKNGVHFTDAHSNSSVCTPTRYGIITGRYAWRSPLKKGVLHGYKPALIEESRPTVASYLKSNGYTTACIGKWHIGLDMQPKDGAQKVIAKDGISNVDFSKRIKDPSDLGFDYSYTMPASLDIPPYVYIENGKTVELPTEYTKGKNEGRGVMWRPGEKAPNFVFEEVLDHFTKKSVSFINEQQDVNVPFFLYFPLTAPHKPWLPVGEAIGKSKAGLYGDYVTMVDDAVGAVVNALKESGQLENTLIIVTSDNGSNWTERDQEKYPHRANYIYKGRKADIYDGGHRVPYIAQWPGVIPAGLESNQLMCTTDLFATLPGILNQPQIEKGAEDSYNLWPAYTSNVKRPIREAVVHHSIYGMFSIRKGKWKYTPQLGSGGFTKPKTVEPKPNEAPDTLYDMINDPEEKNNLYNTHPEVVKELDQLLETYKNQGFSNK